MLVPSEGVSKTLNDFSQTWYFERGEFSQLTMCIQRLLEVWVERRNGEDVLVCGSL